MIETLFVLLTAHFLGDFVLQTDWMVERKRKLRVLFMHSSLVTATTALILGNPHWALLLILFGSHLGMDTLKTYVLPNRTYAFLLDQLVHIGVICVLAYGFSDVVQSGLWMRSLSPDAQRWYLRMVTFLGGFLLCVPVGGKLIGITTIPLLEEIKADRSKNRKRNQLRAEREGRGLEDDDDVEGLRKGGRYIGWLERSLVMLLLLIGQPGGIGFLFAAKSILRFGEIRDSHQRKVAEYIIIGTFLSFGWALLTAYLTQQALTLWRK